MMRSVSAPIALTLITGFLGAGKTTLLNRLLRHPELSRTAVVINEFGEISLDHLLVEKAADGIVEIGDGCLCCTVRGALVDTLSTLSRRAGQLDRVVVETSGLADPAPVLQAVMAHPELSRAYRVEGVVTVVDAVNGAAALEAHEEARQQAALADRLILSKAELAPEAERQALIRRLAALNPNAELLDARAREAATPAVVGPPRLPRRKAAEVYHHHHHHHHHAAGYETLTLTHDDPLPMAAVENFLDLVTMQEGERILRIKGLVETLEEPERPLLVQGARKLLHAPERLPRWPEGARGTCIVLIGQGFEAEYVRRVFTAFAGGAAVDTPDRAAIENNPLAVTGFRG